MGKTTQFFMVILITQCLVSCAMTERENNQQNEKNYKVKQSYLSGETFTASQNEATADQIDNISRGSFQALQSLKAEESQNQKKTVMAEQFSKNENVTLAANNMPMTEFLHYAFGEVLGANYVLSSDLKETKTPVTLNVQNKISKRRLFDLISEVLDSNSVNIDFNEGVFFIQTAQLGKAKAVIGIGRDVNSVPSTARQILQIVPIKYGIRLSLEKTVKQLVDANITADFDQSAFFILGDRANILRALELIKLLDVPANRGKHIGIVSLTYVELADYLTQIQDLMNNEGINVGIKSSKNTNVVLVPLENIGAVAVFATDDDLLQRVRYWTDVIDKPPKGEKLQYFVYHPEFARASDIGDSLGKLLSLGKSRANITQLSDDSTGTSADNLKAENIQGNQVVSGENVSFVVDERANAIIFSTTGNNYVSLLPLLKELDVLPKQVLLDVMIAEVTLSGSFKYGVEFALQQNDYLSISTLGGFSAGDTGGININYIDGVEQILGSFFQDNNFINILSNPSILVRDGVQANINVGTQIPVITGTISTPTTSGSASIVQSNSVDYQQTGVDVSVTPTVNAQGVVIMTINQNISNATDTSSTNSGNPFIFQRSLSTEVVANSGQTVLLGGLISEDTSNGNAKVPLLGDLPLLGKLFQSKNDNKSKTELVMLITPKVIDNNDQWTRIISDFQIGLENIRIVD